MTMAPILPIRAQNLMQLNIIYPEPGETISLPIMITVIVPPDARFAVRYQEVEPHESDWADVQIANYEQNTPSAVVYFPLDISKLENGKYNLSVWIDEGDGLNPGPMIRITIAHFEGAVPTSVPEIEAFKTRIQNDWQKGVDSLLANLYSKLGPKRISVINGVSGFELEETLIKLRQELSVKKSSMLGSASLLELECWMSALESIKDVTEDVITDINAGFAKIKELQELYDNVISYDEYLFYH